tara:strand:+ start:67 stop:486 length:420 start_codon:yes stop_codon:yes gene_type:complete
MLMLENLNDLNLYYTITLRKLALKNNITFEQAKFLANIPYDGVILTGFAKKLGIDNSTLTRNIEKLIVLDLVKIKKSELDQRKKILKLSSFGIQTVKKLEKSFSKELIEIKKYLSSDDILKIKNSLEKLNWAFDCFYND